MKFKKEVSQLQNDKEKDEKQYTESLRKLTEKFEKENKTPKTASKAVLPRSLPNAELEAQLKVWSTEKHLLQKQLQMTNLQVDEARKMSESLMQSYQNIEKSREELQLSNNKLTESLQRSDTRNLNLEAKLKDLRVYK